MNKKIFLTSFLMGGLGNQMFQIAKAQAEGLKNNIKVLFRTKAFIPMDGKQPIHYKDNIFRNVRFDDNLKPSIRLVEKKFNYYDSTNIYTESTEFYGYYQSSKNFLGYDSQIKNLFSPTLDFQKKIENKYPKILEDGSISIHVRRGDYLSIPNILPIMEKSYFDKCLRQSDHKNIFIFSNDKKWVTENMNYKNSTIVDGLFDYEELWAMSMCKNNIMSNSSFSWWGSYLNINRNKKVFCPEIWFGPDGEKEYDSIFENDWIKIK